MKTCFTALLVEFVAMAQFVYPLHDIHPNAECARNLESWVKYQKLLEPNKRDGEPFRDNSYPVCNPRTGEYKSMQCKIGSDADEEFCKCVYPDTNRPIYIYADNERKQLLELSRANFPVLFSGKNFKCEWFHKETKNKKMYSNWKRFVTKVPYQLGLFCNSKFTKNNRCIDKKTKKCINMKKCSLPNAVNPEKDCNCDTECTTVPSASGKSGARDKQLNCDSYMRARSDYLKLVQHIPYTGQEIRTSSEHNAIRRRSENRKRRSKRFKGS